MYIQKLDAGNHNWVKINLAEQAGRVHKYDLFKCSKCNMQGIVKKGTKNIEISEKHRLVNVQKCSESALMKE